MQYYMVYRNILLKYCKNSSPGNYFYGILEIMNKPGKTCIGCPHSDENGCKKGFKTEPLYFYYCFIKEGNMPVEACPGLYEFDKNNDSDTKKAATE